MSVRIPCGECVYWRLSFGTEIGSCCLRAPVRIEMNDVVHLVRPLMRETNFCGEAKRRDAA